MLQQTTLFYLLSALSFHTATAADVFAHFMVQNSYAYTVSQWETDMQSAQQIGVDGFSLDWIPPDCQPGLEWMVSRIADAFTAAENTGFKLIHSFDMSWGVCETYWNQTFMSDILAQHAQSSAAYRWNDKLLVSTYGGDQVAQYGNSFFEGLKSDMQDSNSITLAPALTSYSMAAQANPVSQANQLMSDYPSIDGFLNWQAWPLNVDRNISLGPDLAFQSSLKSAGRSGPYIMAVSPWQYKDLNDGNPLDSWVAYSDTLFFDRFKALTSNSAVQPDIIELLTWNDFCESHYLRDLPSQEQTANDYVELSDMGAYVYGQDHAPWRVMAKYYISWWKTGKPPAVTQDQVVFWYRIHPKATICTGGSSTTIRNHMFPKDAVFAWALVQEPATISMSLGSNEYWGFEADADGPSMGMVPFPFYVPESGVTPSVAIMRNGAMVAVSNATQPITSACSWQNFNPSVNLVGDGSDVGI